MIDVKDRVPAKPGRVKITKEDGSVEYVIIERADEPVEGGTPINKALFDEVVRKKKLIAEFSIAGTYNWEISEEIKNIGNVDVFMMGAGGSGGASAKGTGTNGAVLASGGTSGYIKVLKNYSIVDKDTISIIVGKGGESVSVSASSSSVRNTEGNTGGSTSFDGNVVYGGAGGAGTYTTTSRLSISGATGGGSNSGAVSMDKDTRAITVTDSEYGNPNQSNMAYNPNCLEERYGSAGSSLGIYGYNSTIHEAVAGKTYESASGSGGKANGDNANGNGNGGAAGVAINGTATSGNGSDGIVLIYA